MGGTCGVKRRNRRSWNERDGRASDWSAGLAGLSRPRGPRDRLASGLLLSQFHPASARTGMFQEF